VAASKDGRAASAGPSSFVLNGSSTPQTDAILSMEASLALRWPDVYSGAWSGNTANTKILVGVTRTDASMEAAIRSDMPSPTDVSFVPAVHTLVDKARLAARVEADRAIWTAAGLEVREVRIDGRTDRVVVLVAADGATTRSKSPSLVARYGSDWVTVTAVPR
jgi:hypothetical protein